MKFTTQLELQSQTTRLYERISYAAKLQVKDGILTLYDTLFQKIYTWVTRWNYVSSPQFENPKGFRFSGWALPASLAVTEGILVSFFSSA